ncbi:DUF4381 domain-containing protein [Vibrio astriarenae]|uniref:DUF4381 domain-containing protein n=1 Tax=Vibrio astriarenae TaxID=1481923 RepID=UPI0037359A4A
MTTPHQGQIVEFGSHLIQRAQWIDTPTAVSWLPQTLAWKILFGIALLSTLGYFIVRYHRYLKTTYLREAWQQYLLLDAQQDGAAIAQLMKQTAHQHWPLANVAILKTDEFADFIITHSQRSLSKAILLQLIRSSYQRNSKYTDEMHILTLSWFSEITRQSTKYKRAEYVC